MWYCEQCKNIHWLYKTLDSAYRHRRYYHSVRKDIAIFCVKDNLIEFNLEFNNNAFF